MPIDEDSSLRVQIQKILQSAETLEDVGPLLGCRVSERRLRNLGLWNLRVECVNGGPINTYSTDRVTAGEQGWIGWSYPVSASIFAFEVEAPIQGMPSFGHETVGVPWKMLKVVRSE